MTTARVGASKPRAGGLRRPIRTTNHLGTFACGNEVDILALDHAWNTETIHAGNRTLETTRSGGFVVGRSRPDVDAAIVATTDFVSAGGNEKDAEIDSLARQLRRFYDKYGHKNESGQPHHSPSQIKKLATMYAGRSDKLNEGLAKKYANSLADLSESDDNGEMAEAEAML